MKSWYENQLGDQQQGFRSSRGTTDGIFITKRIQQISHKMKKPLYAVFVDLTAAFDTVCRELAMVQPTDDPDRVRAAGWGVCRG